MTGVQISEIIILPYHIFCGFLFGFVFFVFFCFFYKLQRKTVSDIFHIIPLKLAFISLGAQLDHSAQHLWTSHFGYPSVILLEKICAVLWLVSSAVFPVKGGNFESNEPCKGRDKETNTSSVNVKGHELQLPLSLLLFIYKWCCTAYCVFPFLPHILFHKVSWKLKIFQQRKKNPNHSAMFNQPCTYIFLFC